MLWLQKHDAGKTTSLKGNCPTVLYKRTLWRGKYRISRNREALKTIVTKNASCLFPFHIEARLVIGGNRIRTDPRSITIEFINGGRCEREQPILHFTPLFCLPFRGNCQISIRKNYNPFPIPIFKRNVITFFIYEIGRFKFIR